MANFTQIPQHELIFAWNPKGACSNIKNIICQIEGIEVEKFMSVHSMKLDHLNKQKVLNWYEYPFKWNENLAKLILKRKPYSEYSIIFFSRNPYDRIISGFGKIPSKQILKLGFRKNLSEKENFDLLEGCNISFERYIELVCESDPKYLDTHFRPQTYDAEEIFKHKDLLIYDIENLIDLPKFLLEKYGVKNTITVRQKNNRERPLIPNYYRDMIYDYFKRDFEILGYEKESDKSKSFFSI